MRIGIISILFLLCGSVLYSQKVLTIQDAISIGLKNNFDIQIARTEAEIDKTNNTAGNAGMMPNINLNLGAGYALNTTRQELYNRNVISKSGASVQTYNAGVVLNWTIFDGMKMFTTKQKLYEIEKLGELKYRSQLQQSVSLIIASYYDIVKQSQQLNAVLEVKALSGERMKLGETRFKAGLSPKTEMLQAEIDYNIQLQNEVLQRNIIEESKRKLNQLINRELSEDFVPDENIPVTGIDSTDAVNKIMQNNPAIQSLNQQLEIQKLSVNEFESSYLPLVNLTAGYLLNLSENSGSQVNYNRGYGPQIGVTFSVPLYQGGNITRQVQTSGLEYNSLLLQLESLKTQSLTQFRNALNQFKTQLKFLEIEEKTKIVAKENLFLAMERLKLSQTTSIEVRDAQLSYENSLTRLSNIRYNLKIAETQIKLLMGEL